LSVRAPLGGPEFEYQLIGKEDWIGRRLVADRFREGRAFICGDAAHLWVPYAGYGMNAGIADAMNLSWMLAAHLKGWAAESILAAHELERQPITEQVSRFAMKHAAGAIRERTSVPPQIEDDTPEGAAVRRQVGEAAYQLHVQQFAYAGLNYGYFYDRSPSSRTMQSRHHPIQCTTAVRRASPDAARRTSSFGTDAPCTTLWERVTRC